MPIQLSTLERAFLINQLEIRKAVTESDEFDQPIEILQHGYEIFYDDAMGMVLDPMPREAGKFVLDVLSMYRAIGHYLDQHPEDAKLAGEPWARFGGFDGNNETEYMSFTRFLVEKQGKFAEQKEHAKQNDDFNSHMPTLPRYQQMLEKWKAQKDAYKLTREQVVAILARD